MQDSAGKGVSPDHQGPTIPSSEGIGGSIKEPDPDGKGSLNSAPPCTIQGAAGRVGVFDGTSNPYHEHPGSGIGDVMLDLGSLDKPPDWYGKATRNVDFPPLPMVLCRDLSNCIDGMPRNVGTTIAGKLRPDTGWLDPVVADHTLWRYYESHLLSD